MSTISENLRLEGQGCSMTKHWKTAVFGAITPSLVPDGTSSIRNASLKRLQHSWKFEAVRSKVKVMSWPDTASWVNQQAEAFHQRLSVEFYVVCLEIDFIFCVRQFHSVELASLDAQAVAWYISSWGISLHYSTGCIVYSYFLCSHVTSHVVVFTIYQCDCVLLVYSFVIYTPKMQIKDLIIHSVLFVSEWSIMFECSMVRDWLPMVTVHC